MQKFTKKDLFFSIVTGLITGVITWRIFVFLKAPSFGLTTHALFIIIIPILWVVGVNFGYILGRRIPFFTQFGKFVAIGFTNAAVDFGILNLLIAYTGFASGILFSVFKGASFLGAMLHSYVWNKFWVFDSGGSGGGKVEFAKFASVAVFTILINVGVASFVVNFVDPFLGFDDKTWANMGAVAGAAIGLLFSFVGYKLLVFKKEPAKPIGI